MRLKNQLFKYNIDQFNEMFNNYFYLSQLFIYNML